MHIYTHTHTHTHTHIAIPQAMYRLPTGAPDNTGVALSSSCPEMTGGGVAQSIISASPPHVLSGGNTCKARRDNNSMQKPTKQPKVTAKQVIDLNRASIEPQ